MNFLNKLLNYYKISEDEYQLLTQPINKITLPDPFKLIGMRESIEIINSTINKKEKIVIYGDYDCDGVMATSILVKAFKMLNYDVGFYIPSRYTDGYGLTKEKIKQFKDKNYSLIITVDNGITLFDEIKFANDLGMKVIITDHHTLTDKLPLAASIIHPVVSKLGDVVASGGVMSYFLAAALLGHQDDYLLALAAISTISDLMELKEYNRDIVRLALDHINNKQYLQLVLLNNNDIHFDENSLALKIAPKVNALGRILKNNKTNYLVNYFTTDDKNKIYEIYSFIESINETRKELTKECYSELLDLDKNAAAIVAITNAKEGLIGLMAAKLVNEYDKPAIIFTYDENNPDQLKGSARSKKGFSIIKAFKSLEKYIIRSGGHSLAGGLIIKRENFNEFAKGFISLANEYCFIQDEDHFIEISLNDISDENYEIIKKFSPFGQGFKEPLLKISNIKSSELKFMSQGKHISTPLSISSRLIGFNISKDDVTDFLFINIFGFIRKNNYKNYITIDFLINKISN